MAQWHDFYESRANDTWPQFLARGPRWASIVEHITSLPVKKLLEVGCGPASLGIFFSFLGYEVTGIDREEAVVELARARNEQFRGRATFQQADAFSLPFEDDEFDCAYNQGVFMLFPDEDIRALVRECLRVAPHLIFSVPNANHPRQDFGTERLMTGQQWDKILSPFNVIWSREEAKAAAWHSMPRRLWEMFCSFVLRKDVRKPRRYVAYLRRSDRQDAEDRDTTT